MRLTPEQIDALPAGREMDIKVGDVFIRATGRLWFDAVIDGGETTLTLPCSSTSVSDALAALEEMRGWTGERKAINSYDLSSPWNDLDEEFEVIVYQGEEIIHTQRTQSLSLPLAICRAILKAAQPHDA